MHYRVCLYNPPLFDFRGLLLIMIFVVVELVSISVGPVGAHVTVWRFHQDLEVRHRLEILQISLGREEAAVGC